MENINKDTNQYCTFKIGKDYFGVSVLDVQEVIKPLPITPIPKTDKRVSGLMNLRGLIVTTISMRNMFKMEEHEDDYMNVIIRIPDGLVALKVDEIEDVVTLNNDSFEAAPSTLSSNIKDYVKGVHKMKGRILVVLDLDKLLGFTVEKAS